MSKPTKNQSLTEISLPSYRSFVVQLEAHSELTEENLKGRIEHLVTGRATRFQSVQELMGFIRWSFEPENPDSGL